MKDWLSSTWEPSWKPFRYFNYLRLLFAGALLASFLFPGVWNYGGNPWGQKALQALGLIYLLLAGLGTFISSRWHKRFNLQLTLQVALDALAIGIAMAWLGGVSSGVGVLMMISLAAASLVGRGRLVLFYAAMATLVILLLQFWGVVQREFEAHSLVQAALLSGGFFATAIVARLLGQRAMVQEDLARRRGEALSNQIRIGHRIMERMQDGVLVVDREGVALQHNPGAESMLGLPTSDGTALAQHSKELARAYVRWLSGEPITSVDFEGVTGRQLRARFEATDSTNGETLVFIEDVGRVRQQAKQMKLASLGRLTASIAHEVRNPLAAISHASDLLHEERRGDMHDRLLRILHDNIFRIDRIVQDILQLGRSDRGQPEPLAVESLMPGFIEEFTSVERVEPGVVEVDMAPLDILFDRSQLLQVLWNLLANAVRHSRRQAGSVRVVVAQDDEGRVELHVIDDGPGIPEDQRDLIFEPFFTTRHQGTGLGLFIARELCEANGATLQLIPGGGGHFVIIGGSACQPTATTAGQKAA